MQKGGFLEEGGESAEVIRNLDWTATSLGSIDRWPANLQSTLALVLRSGFPMFLVWGADLICFHNDAFHAGLGGASKHSFIGKKASGLWANTPYLKRKVLEDVLFRGKSAQFEDTPISLHRDGRYRDTYWTFHYSPVPGDEDKIAGIFIACVETTEKVKSHRVADSDSGVRESESGVRDIVPTAPIGICILDAPTLVAEVVNDSFVEVAGKPRESIVGKYYWEPFAEAKPFYENALAGVARDGKTFVADEVALMLIRHGREEWIYVSFVYSPVFGATGQVTKVVVWVLENTNQVVARQRVEEAEKKAILAINSANLGVYEIDYASDSMVTDDRFKAIWGSGGPAFSRADYVRCIHPDDRPHREDAHQRSVRTGQLDYRCRILWPDGSAHWARITGTVLYDQQSRPLKLIGVAQDITEAVLAQRKIEDSEKSIRTMILRAPVAMCILRGPSYLVSIANSKMLELWGKQEEEMLDKPLFEGLPEARDQGLEALLEKVYTTGETFTAYERPVTLPRNNKLLIVYVDFVYELLETGDGQTKNILVVAIDVSYQVLARQKIEEIVAERTNELAQSNLHLERSNAELRQFAYITSHDLQEPIRKIAIYASMLEDEPGTGANARNYLDKIITGSRRMQNLIRDVLSYSELSRRAPTYEPVNLQKVVEDAISELDLLIEQKSAVIRYGGLPTIEAIPLQMSQLFSNLLSNALKYAQAGKPPDISISCRPENRGFQIAVTDNGIGFSQEYADQIFSIFKRLHRKEQYSGTGIGLAMCKKIIENHNGIIKASSVPGEGATFAIYLPARHQ